MRSVFLLALVGCTSPTAPEPAGDHYAYTIDHLNVPANNTQARDDGFDLNGDGTIDNQLGQVFGTMDGLGIDCTGATAHAVADGMIALGIDLQTTAFDEAAAAGFTTSASSGAALAGTAEDGTFTLGPGTVSIAIAVADPKLVVPIDLTDAHVTLTGVDASGIAHGVIAGGVTPENLRDDFFPALAVAFDDIVKRDCTGSGSLCGCADGSSGRLLVDYFDYPTADCTITADEIAANALTASLFAPDLAIAGQKVVSFGVGFSATRRN